MAENGINLGPLTQPMPYADKSTSPPTSAHFDHTVSTHIHTPVAPSVLAPTAISLDHAFHPDHALYRQARSAVHGLDAQHGRSPDQRSDNLAAALAVAARRDGLSAIHYVVLSEDAPMTFAVQSAPRSVLKQMTRVNTEQAIQTSVAQSSQAWDRLAQHSVVEPLSAQSPQPLQASSVHRALG